MRLTEAAVRMATGGRMQLRVAKAPKPAGGDLGPDVRRDEARVGAGRTVVVDRPDPRHPSRTVRGAVASPPHHRLLLQGVLSPDAYEAGQAYVRLWMLREHGRSPDPDAPRVHRAPWQRCGEMAADRAAAAARLDEARVALGPMPVAVIELVCVAEVPMWEAYGHAFPMLSGDAGPSRPVRAAVMQGMVVVALDMLARAWGGGAD
jgi:hypothetical protein